MSGRVLIGLRVLGLLFVSYVALFVVGSVVEPEPFSIVALLLVGVVAVAGWALLSNRRWGYWLSSLIALYHLAGGAYLLTFGQHHGDWTTPIGVWLFLLPGGLMVLLLLLRSSRHWGVAQRAEP